MRKEDIKENHDRLIAGNIHITGVKETSGTLGLVTKVLNDRNYEKHATDEYFNAAVGLTPGTSRLILKDDPNAIEAITVGGFDYEISPLRKVYRIDHLYLDDRKLDFIIDILQKKKPEVIWGDSYAATVIARYIADNGIDVPSPEFLLLGAQMLLPKYRKEIEEVFRAPVYDRYGSTETGNTANQCLAKDGYHYVPITHFIEILDENNQPVADGEQGRLVITSLARRAKPFIRYDIGDLAVADNEKCPCGSNFPLIRNIDGKIKEGVISPKGTYMNVGPLGLIMDNFEKIIDFQMVQPERDRLLLKLICKNHLMTAESDKIIKDINNLLDYDMKTSIEYTEKLMPMPSGKVLRVIPYERYLDIKEYMDESI